MRSLMDVPSGQVGVMVKGNGVVEVATGHGRDETSFHEPYDFTLVLLNSATPRYVIVVPHPADTGRSKVSLNDPALTDRCTVSVTLVADAPYSSHVFAVCDAVPCTPPCTSVSICKGESRVVTVSEAPCGIYGGGTGSEGGGGISTSTDIFVPASVIS